MVLVSWVVVWGALIFVPKNGLGMCCAEGGLGRPIAAGAMAAMDTFGGCVGAGRAAAASLMPDADLQAAAAVTPAAAEARAELRYCAYELRKIHGGHLPHSAPTHHTMPMWCRCSCRLLLPQAASQLPMLLPGQQLMPFMPPQPAQSTSQQPGQQGTPSPSTAAAGSSSGGNPTAAPATSLQLCGLELVLGPELRAVFPVVLNVGVSGNLLLSGNPAQPHGLVPSGVIRLEGGVLNLVATQFRLDRDHPNTITFSPEAGLDPMLDVALSSSELRASIAGEGCKATVTGVPSG